MFASTELAARIDAAETRLSVALGRVAVSHRPASAFVAPIGDGVAVFAGPSSPVNKMIGVGFAGLPAEAALDAVESRFREREAPLQAEVATLADPALASLLARRGYVLQGFENVLGLRIDAADARPRAVSGFDIRLVEAGGLEAWADASVTGFATPDLQGVPGEPLPPRDALEGTIREFSEAPGFRRYAAWVDGRMAGAATMRVDADIALLCGASTLPEFRRRGIQTAFLRRRLADALAAGCGLAVVTTSPGSRSQENSARQGFALLYCRALLVKVSAR